MMEERSFFHSINLTFSSFVQVTLYCHSGIKCENDKRYDDWTNILWNIFLVYRIFLSFSSRCALYISYRMTQIDT